MIPNAVHHCPCALPREGQRLFNLPCTLPEADRCPAIWSLPSSYTASLVRATRDSVVLSVAGSTLTLLGQISLEHQNTYLRFVCKDFPDLDCIWDGQHAGPWAGPAKPAGNEAFDLLCVSCTPLTMYKLTAAALLQLMIDS